MNEDIKIIQLLLSRKDETYTIKKIADVLKINYRIAYEKVMLLEKDGLLNVTKVGNSKLCAFNYTFSSKVYEAEFNRRQIMFKNKDFVVLQDMLSKLNFGFVALIFGSHVKGTATKNSDIDILTIGGNEKEIAKALSLWPDKIHLTSITCDEFVLMAKSKEFTVVSEAIKNNIILVGIEEYYRLIKNVGFDSNSGS
jgi:predicted nucleotidyltransferase